MRLKICPIQFINFQSRFQNLIHSLNRLYNRKVGWIKQVLTNKEISRFLFFLTFHLHLVFSVNSYSIASSSCAHSLPPPISLSSSTFCSISTFLFQKSLLAGDPRSISALGSGRNFVLAQVNISLEVSLNASFSHYLLPKTYHLHASQPS